MGSLRSFVMHSIDEQRVAAAIRDAEAASTAEIRVHVTGERAWDVQRAAERTFAGLGMTATRDRNGVLLYIAPRVRRFAVVGDVAAHEHCGDRLWQAVAAAVEWHFRRGAFTEGIVEAVGRLGAALADQFPRRPGEADVNELGDEPTGD